MIVELCKGGVVRHKRCVSETLKKHVAAGQAWRCRACGELLSAHFEVDHVLSLRRGGSNEPRNLQALCRECHARKGFAEAETECRQLVLESRFEAAARGSVPLGLVAAACAWPPAETPARLEELGYSVGQKHARFPPALWRRLWAAAGVASPPELDLPAHGLRARRRPASAPALSLHSRGGGTAAAAPGRGRRRPTCSAAADLEPSSAAASEHESTAAASEHESTAAASQHFEKFRFKTITKACR
jgi:hypothetical protein